mmetsp:Transcript_33686/g.66720  ORF Transcript_33686/g.66720 Transcript_33686/m.66720 type:complete len:83 (-) Transcript_33686:93-341(-)
MTSGHRNKKTKCTTQRTSRQEKAEEKRQPWGVFGDAAVESEESYLSTDSDVSLLASFVPEAFSSCFSSSSSAPKRKPTKKAN